MNIKPIKTEQDYDNTLQRIDELMEVNPALNTPLSDELEILVLLIEKYEKKHWRITTTDCNECYCSEIPNATNQRWKKSQISDEELYQFAKYNPNIKRENCHINAMLVHNWLGTNCKIFIGYPTFITP